MFVAHSNTVIVVVSSVGSNGAGDVATSNSKFFWEKLIRVGQIWLKVIVWANWIRSGQNQNLASPKAFKKAMVALYFGRIRTR